MKIDLLYIKESKRIIDTYDELIEYVNSIYTILDNNKNILLDIQKDIYNIDNDNKETKLVSLEKLQECILEYDKEIIKIQKELNPYLTKIEKVKKDSVLLYKTIKENYPGVSDTDLQIQIQTQIKELKKEEL
jgi:hypothetical protein